MKFIRFHSLDYKNAVDMSETKLRLLMNSFMLKSLEILIIVSTFYFEPCVKGATTNSLAWRTQERDMLCI